MKPNYVCFIHDGIATIPYGTRVIEESAFQDCDYLYKVIIPNTVVSIENYAFEGCLGLVDIEIPNSVCEIGEQAFCCCGFHQMDLPDSVRRIGKGAFYGTSLVSFQVPSQIKEIEESTFGNCRDLVRISFPNGLKRIGDSAFANCTNLQNLVFPQGLQSIGPFAFRNCESLRHLHIPNGVSSIESLAFEGCSGIEHITGGSVCYQTKGDCLLSLHRELVLGCKNSIIPSNANVQIIKKSAFFRSGVETITIPVGVNRIEGWAFSCCHELKSVRLPSSIEEIDLNPFSYCPNLNSIIVEEHYFSEFSSENNCLLDFSKRVLIAGCNSSIIPSTVEVLSPYAFQGSGVSSIVIPNGVTTLGSYVFDSCKALTSVSIPESLREWGRYCFSGCNSLREIKLFFQHPSSISYWDKYHLFSGLDLTKLTLLVPIGAGYEYRHDSLLKDCTICPILRESDNCSSTDGSGLSNSPQSLDYDSGLPWDDLNDGLPF